MKEDWRKSAQDQYLTTQTTILELAIDKEIQSYIVPDKAPAPPQSIWGELLSMDFLKQLFLPLVIFGAMLYQFYFKRGSSKVATQPRRPRSKAEYESEITRRINNLSGEIGGGSRLHGEAALSKLEHDMDRLQTNLKGQAESMSGMGLGMNKRNVNKDERDEY